MARIKKTKSSQLAKGIELIESGIKTIKEFSENIDPFLLDSDKLKQIKPLIENLAKTISPDQETPDQETPDQETPDQEAPDEARPAEEPAD